MAAISETRRTMRNSCPRRQRHVPAGSQVNDGEQPADRNASDWTMAKDRACVVQRRRRPRPRIVRDGPLLALVRKPDRNTPRSVAFASAAGATKHTPTRSRPATARTCPSQSDSRYLSKVIAKNASTSAIAQAAQPDANRRPVALGEDADPCRLGSRMDGWSHDDFKCQGANRRQPAEVSRTS